MKTLRDAITLTKAGVSNGFNINMLRGKGGSKSVLAAVVVVVLLLPYLFYLFWMLSGFLYQTGQLSLMLYLAVLAVAIMTLFTTSYKAMGYLFNIRDFDMLSSLPVSNSSVFISKLFMLFISNFIPQIYIALTIILIFGIRSGAGALYYVLGFLLFPLVGVIPMIVGVFLSFVISKIASKLKRSNLASILGAILLIVFIVGIQFLSTGFSSMGSIPDFTSIMRFFPIGLYYINAVVKFDILDIILLVGINLLLLALFIPALAGNFRKINADLGERGTQARYKMKSLRTSSVLMSLYKKELRFYFSSTIYMVNTGIGMILLLVYSGAILIFGSKVVMAALEIPGASNIIAQMSTVIGCFCIAITLTASSSISLEGKSLWIIKSLPVSFRQIALSKILVNLTIIVPAYLISAVVLAVALNFSPVSFLLFVAAGLCYSLLIPVLGLICNLQFPKLEWKSHTQAVKQSASVLVSMFSSAATVVIPMMIYIFIVPDYTIFALCTCVVLLAVTFALWLLLMRWGKEQFDSIY